MSVILKVNSCSLAAGAASSSGKTAHKRTVSRLALSLAAAAILSFSFVPQAHAAPYSIANGDNIDTDVPSITSGDVWNLAGDARYFVNGVPQTGKTLPLNGTLTINGQPGGSIITMSDDTNSNYVYFIGGSTTVNLNNVTLTGGRQHDGGLFKIDSGGVLTLNTTGVVSLDNSTATAGNGGAIYTEGGLQVNGNLSASGNSAYISGGAIYALSGDVNVTGDVTLSNNTALGLVTSDPGNGWGGAIDAVAGGVTLGSGGNTIRLTGNVAQNSGGAIYSARGVTINGNLIATGNTATDKNGGAIFANDGDIVVNGNVTANNNTAGNNGGVMTAANGSIIVNGDISASGNSGNYGGVLNASADVIITGNAILNNNKATTGNGGAILARRDVIIDGNLTADGNQSNLSGYVGGGVIESQRDVVVKGAVNATNNSSAGYGGVINALNGTVTLGSSGLNSTLSNNSAHAGGAIYAYQAITLNGNWTANDNSASTGNGGVLYIDGGDVQVNGSFSAARNTAKISGGAIFASGRVTITGAVTLDSNNATGLDNWTPGNGGAIRAGSGLTLGLTGASSITNNRASGDGGALWSGGDTEIRAGNGDAVFSNNQADGLGGAIYSSTGDVTLNAAGGDISFRGNKQGSSAANALYLNNSGGGTVLTVNADAGRSVTFFDPVTNNAANGLVSVNKTGTGLVSFDGSLSASDADRWSKLYADTTVSAGTFEVANNAVYGALSTDAPTPVAATSFTADAGSRVQGGGTGTIRADNFTLNGDMSIAGRHSSADDFSTFNVFTGNAHFGNGTIYFNTYLNNGAPDNQKTDLLVLDLNGSTASGHALIDVTNVGGPGQWTQDYNGIMLVQTVNGITPGPDDPLVAAVNPAADTFTLARRVAAGAYDYFLYRGGLDGNPQNANNWYLRNTYVAPTPPESIMLPPTADDPADPGASDDPAPQSPRIIAPRPELATNAAILPLAIQYGYAMLDTVHERAAENYISPAAPAYEERSVWCKDAIRNFRCTVRVPVAAVSGAGGPGGDETRWARSGWARLIGSRGTHNPDNYFRRGPDYDYTIGGIQAGLDVFAREQADGALDKAGIYVGYGRIDATVKGFDGAYYGPKAGTVEMNAYTLGGYWTHFAPDGWYTDAVVQGTRYADTQARSILNETLTPDGFGILGSLEGGYAFRFSSGWTLEPQAQIVYQNVTFDHARDSFGVFRFQDGDSLRGRLGARLSKTWDMAGANRPPRLVTGWLRGNIWHEFLGDTRSLVAGFDGQNPLVTPSSLKGTWGEIGAGVSARMSEKVNLFATGAYQHSLDGKDNQSWDGRLGLTARW